jgi:hypothetical protein
MEHSKLIANSMYVYDVHFITTFCLGRRIIALKSDLYISLVHIISENRTPTAISCQVRANIYSIPQTENSTLYSEKPMLERENIYVILI